ncbi:MAG: hypothetical protein CXT73_02600 [Methanobacteriota archaeon]|jgi:MoaA/NifB/PqqE/SkfB family radical SAM enzyme|nr:MAG: hypothetical protein CXT73_02600 [Euryarchaeota archaeon]
MLIIKWELGDKCNYRCSYCSEFHYGNKYPFPTLNDSINFIRSLPKKETLIIISGGEPTLWHNFRAISNYAKTQNHITLASFTNAYRKINWWNNNYDLCDAWEISYHWEYANQNHIFDILDLLDKKSITSYLHCMFQQERIDDIKLLHDRYREKKYNYSAFLLKKIRQNIYTEDELLFCTNVNQLPLDIAENIIKTHRHPEQKSITNITNFYNWKCNAGSDYLRIHPDKNVYSCGYKNDLLGTINDFTILDSPTICKQKKCATFDEREVYKVCQ